MSSPLLSEPHLEALKNALEQVCNDTLPKWNASVGDRMILATDGLDFATVDQVTPTLKRSAVWFGASSDDGLRRVAFGFTNGLAYDLVNRLLGTKAGSPTTCNSVTAERPLTDLERAVLEQMVRDFSEQLSRMWSRLAQQSLALESAQGFRSEEVLSESFLWCRFRAKLIEKTTLRNSQTGSHEDSPDEESFFLAIPLALIEPHSARLLNHFYSGCRPEQPESVAAEDLELQNKEMHIVANLVKSTISLEELRDLKVGDIIATEIPVERGVEVEVEGVGAFRGRPGVVHGHRAIEIYESDAEAGT